MSEAVGPAVGVAEPLSAARALGPRIRELAPEIERERRLPQALVDELLKAGLFHLLLPRSLGGPEGDPVTAARVVEEVASADASAGWCVMLAHQTSSFAGFVLESEARAIWGGGGIVAGTARPIGRATPAREQVDGYIVSGRWPFASGSTHATWFSAECTVYDGDEVRKDEQGNAVALVVFVPREQVTVHDTWYTLGLRGTASNDFSIDPVFVPASRCFRMLVDEPLHPWALYREPGLVFMNHGSHALGVARGAVASAKEIAKSKVGWGGVPLRDFTRVQGAIAEGTALVEAGRSYLYSAAEELWAAAQRGEADLGELRARVRLASAHAATSSVQAVDLVHSVVATSAIFTSSPLERQFRDMRTAAAHVMIGPLVFEAAGRVELGMPAAFPFF